MNGKIQRAHIERQAVVYLRQSTLKQVYEHRESTTRQYALKERAIALGWPVDQVKKARRASLQGDRPGIPGGGENPGAGVE
jgi:DNA invertase Pin-like site-specific DNA recombinase